uniref:Integrase core domain containing protein n=1 Tax=Solanum tuberosum TaxID=4113 RepID=M1DXS6_SOLTU
MARLVTEERRVLVSSLYTTPVIHDLFQRNRCLEIKEEGAPTIGGGHEGVDTRRGDETAVAREIGVDPSSGVSTTEGVERIDMSTTESARIVYESITKGVLSVDPAGSVKPDPPTS